MSLIVQKFGGTSVGSLERIQHVANIIKQTRDEGNQVVVVVSAMHGETDRLIDLAHATSPQPAPNEFDALLATGEQASAALLSMTLLGAQCPARSLTGAQARIKTNKNHRKARILEIDPNVVHETLEAGQVPVIAGFQGVTEHGHVTTIGRGGSDVTAVAIAAALKADECQIYTDVNGVYTTDPRVVKQARLLEQITFEEMLEMANLGAKVMQRHAVEFAHQNRVPVRVLSSFDKGPGTLITFADQLIEEPLVSGIAFDRDQAKITLTGIPADPASSSRILTAMSEADIDVDMMVQNVPSPKDKIDFSFTVHLDDFKEAHSKAQALGEALKAETVHGDDHIAKLSIVGLGMKTHASVAAKMLSALGEEGINIHLITSSEVKISTVIDEKYMELGARTLHNVFGLDQPKKPH